MFARFWEWLKSLFFTISFELCLIGLQNAGKTSLVSAIAGNDFAEEVVPTVGFNLRKITKGNVTFSLWDIGGQPRFRSIWQRYCAGSGAIIFVVDAADKESLPSARSELHALLEKKELMGIPVLVLGNKNDLPEHAEVKELIAALNLTSIKDREVSCYSVSAKNGHNMDVTLNWLLKRARS